MTSEKPDKCLADGEQNSGEQFKPNSDLNQVVTTTTATTTTAKDSSNNDEFPQSVSQQNTPIKRQGNENVSPSKYRNRKRNDARRRSANYKKQAATSNDQSENQKQQQSQSPNKHVNIQNQQSKDSDVHKSRKSPIDLKISEAIEDNHLQRSGTIESNTKGSSTGQNAYNRREKHSEVSKERLREFKELKEHLKSQNTHIQNLIVQIKQQSSKIKELDTALLSTTRTCNQLDKLLQQEIVTRTNLETENQGLNQTVARLKSQISAHEKNKFNNDELVRVLNATLMERETEVSILKLKLTRIQTNPSSIVADSTSSKSLVKIDPCHVYATTGRSNSEFDRNSYIRSSMIAEAASARASTSHLKGSDKDASIWATVPEELTPSKRPQNLERGLEPLYGDSYFNNPYSDLQSLGNSSTPSPLVRDRRYKTLPRSLRNTSQEISNARDLEKKSDLPCLATEEVTDSRQPTHCQITNLDDSNNTSQSSGNKTINSIKIDPESQHLTNDVTLKDVLVNSRPQESAASNEIKTENLNQDETSHYSNIKQKSGVDLRSSFKDDITPPSLPSRAPTTPVKLSSSLKRIFDKFKRSDSSNSQSKTDLTNLPQTPTTPFKRGANRSTLVCSPADIRAQITPVRQVMNFQPDKPFAEWDTDMLVEWMTMIGLSMYTTQCRRWVRCGAHIMNATPAEVDKGLGITNHLHRKKLRLAISELNGDCDKVTKAAAKLDYLWVARWLDDIGLPQHKESFIDARIDGRVLNYLTIEDLVSMGVKSILHHASIRCGIKVLRSINFDLQLLKRRATAEEIEQMSSMRQQLTQVDPDSPSFKQTMEKSVCSETDVPLWTCHRIMEWLRLIDFAEFAPNLRGSGVHGGLIVFEDGFNFDTMCSILSIPISRTLLRRHLSSYFKSLIGSDLSQKKRQHQDLSSNQQLNPLAEIKVPKKSQWFNKLRSSRVGQDAMDEYLCPMYPVEPQMIKSKARKSGGIVARGGSQQLSKIPESINV